MKYIYILFVILLFSTSCLTTQQINRESHDNKKIEISIALPKSQNLIVYQDNRLFNEIEKHPPRRHIWDKEKNNFFEVVIKNISKQELMFYKYLARPRRSCSDEGFFHIYCTDSEDHWYQVKYKAPAEQGLAGSADNNDYKYYILESNESLVIRVYYRKYFENFPTTLAHHIFKMKIKLKVSNDDLWLSSKNYKSSEHPFWTGTVESKTIEVKLIN